MKRVILTLALAVAAPLAFAHNCPNEMKAIDAALPKAKLDARQMAEVKKLRADGEADHKAGKHKDSTDKLEKAMDMLGVGHKK